MSLLRIILLNIIVMDEDIDFYNCNDTEPDDELNEFNF